MLSTRKTSKNLPKNHNETFGGSLENQPLAASFLADLSGYLSDFKHVFKSKTRTCYKSTSSYFKGLIQAEKKKGTCTGIGAIVPDCNSQALNHQLTDGKWSYQLLMDLIATRCSDFFTNFCNVGDTYLAVDEVGFPKKGKSSACVGRQWLGCIGKQDNGQVAVALSLGNKFLSSIINLQLFIPIAWSKDKDRCGKAGVPVREHQTKPEIALEMIKKAVAEKIKFSWVTFDALYGSSLPFIRALQEMGVVFVGDLRGDITIYPEKPMVSIPVQKGQGRQFRFPRPEGKATEIEKYAKSLEEKDWCKLSYREGTTGRLEGWFHKKQIWIWDKKQRELVSYILLIRKSLDGKEYKFSLSNADSGVSIVRLGYMQGQRFFIEQSFKEGKNQTGMGDYQVRSWEGFHRHMSLSMLALNFLMEQKYKHNKDELQGITLPKLVLLIKVLLPVKNSTFESTFNEIKKDLTEYRRQKQKKSA